MKTVDKVLRKFRKVERELAAVAEGYDKEANARFKEGGRLRDKALEMDQGAADARREAIRARKASSRFKSLLEVDDE